VFLFSFYLVWRAAGGKVFFATSHDFQAPHSMLTIPTWTNLIPGNSSLSKRARVNNLKKPQRCYPRNKLVVITGLSGPGKSSLAFDTLFAEGQRNVCRKFKFLCPPVIWEGWKNPKSITSKEFSPAIAIEQRVNTRNPRSTVGTTTEIYDYLKLLFARIGKTISPISGKEVKRDTVTMSWMPSTN